MNFVIVILIWGVLSAAVMGCVNPAIERRGGEPYQRKWYTIVVGIALLGISMLSGYAVWLKAVSVTAGLRLAVTYFFILAAAMIDWKTHMIPNMIPGLLIVSRFVILIYEILTKKSTMEDVLNSVLGALVCAVVLLIAGKVTSGGIGAGDVKLLIAIGFMCGVELVFTVLLLSLFCCVAVSVVLVLLKKCTMKDHLAFGPFIYAGYVAMLIGTLC